MELKTCMNAQCGASTSSEWKKGWALRSGEFVTLCDKCGGAYEQLIFCEVFHLKESGWRECAACGKRLHCGCIASRSFIELLDSGGVSCISCAKHSGLKPMGINDKPNGFSAQKVDDTSELHSLAVESHFGGGTAAERALMQLNHIPQSIGLKHLLQLQKDGSSQSVGKIKQEESPGKLDIYNPHNQIKDIYDPIAQTNLSISLGPSANLGLLHGAVPEERGKASSSFPQAPRSRQLLPKPPRSDLGASLEPSISLVPQIRVARPPAEGRGKTQLLPRYWPRITDQELQQISGDSNSTIVPLFEKVLSASDAGRIGRLVLPKACAEAYFPPISQPEGLPLKIQDMKGKEWVFQFRFWPNNNSRMYVLEGVTPCIQSMQLQAGDTVTFSRMDPEGKLVMGFRKATATSTVQDALPSAIPSVTHSSESFFSGVFENLPIMSGYSGLLQPLKGSNDPNLNAISKHLNSAGGGINWHAFEQHDEMAKDNLLMPPTLGSDRKRSRNIGSKNKRLLIDTLDALELKLTWEEVQDLLRPPPSAKPSIVTIEDHEFEEYEEPPVFGKRSIFVMRSTGVQEQWAQCDSCSKWRRLPIDILLPPKWTCAENTWDQSRSSCAASDELTPREQENLLRQSKDFKRRRFVTGNRPIQELDSSALDAPGNATTSGDNASDPGPASVAATTKHPRHRPGCSCIVCIQPPSGKGKHKPTCTCNVCMTVKRRFKTLMMRKKKRQSEREAEIVQRTQQASGSREEAEVESASKHLSPLLDSSENETRSVNALESNKSIETSAVRLDLNFHPDRAENSGERLDNVSMMGLLQVANLPLEMYLKQQGLTSLVSDQAPSSSQLQVQAAEETEKQVKEECSFPPTQEHENGNEESSGTGSDQIQNSTC